MIRRFIAYYKPVRKLLFVDMLSAILIAGIDLITPRFTSHMIDVIIPSMNVTLVLRWSFYLLIAYAIRVSLQYVVEYWGHILGVRMEFAMRKQLFAHIQQLPIRFFDNIKVGKLMSRLVNDLNDISEVAHHGPEDLLISVVLLVGSFTMMYLTQWKLALILTVLVPLMIAVGISKNLKFRKAFRELRRRVADINAQAEDNFSGIRVVKAFTAESQQEQLFDDGNQRFATSRISALKTMAEFGVSVKFFIYIIQLVVFFVGARLIISNQMSIGGLVEFLLYVQLFQQPINRISGFIMQYNQAMAGFERFLEVVDTPAQSNAGDKIDDLAISGRIHFENVTFGYGDVEEDIVLNSINIHIPEGKTLALVGPSGGGKTTLASLIPRFYEVEQGRITIDEIDIRDFDLGFLRRQIGIIQQDVFIFAGTIGENLAIAKPEASQQELIDALKKAEAWEFVSDLPSGLDTQIGQRGVKLSGGQKQRIALARVFLKNPPILILDEATSALDNKTERYIQRTLETLSVGRTTLVIAHRLSTIEKADQILVLSKDGILEEGNHTQLMNQKGFYYHLRQGEATI